MPRPQYVPSASPSCNLESSKNTWSRSYPNWPSSKSGISIRTPHRLIHSIVQSIFHWVKSKSCHQMFFCFGFFFYNYTFRHSLWSFSIHFLRLSICHVFPIWRYGRAVPFSVQVIINVDRCCSSRPTVQFPQVWSPVVIVTCVLCLQAAPLFPTYFILQSAASRPQIVRRVDNVLIMDALSPSRTRIHTV